MEEKKIMAIDAVLSLEDEEDNLPQEMTIKLNADSEYLATPADELIGVVREGYRVTSVDDFLGDRELMLMRA
jgi:hypothetical protein